MRGLVGLGLRIFQNDGWGRKVGTLDMVRIVFFICELG